MNNTFPENVFVCEDFISTVNKTSCIENIRFLGGLPKMLSVEMCLALLDALQLFGIPTTRWRSMVV